METNRKPYSFTKNKAVKTLAAAGVASALLFTSADLSLIKGATPVTANAKTIKTYKTTATMILRSKAGTSKSAKKIMRVKAGTTVKTSGKAKRVAGKSYYYVKVGSKKGYLAAKYIKKTTTYDYKTASAKTKAARYKTTGGMYLRTSAGLASNNKKIKAIRKGSIVKIYGTRKVDNGNYTRVKVDGKIGYLGSKYISKVSESKPVNVALNMVAGVTSKATAMYSLPGTDWTSSKVATIPAGKNVRALKSAKYDGKHYTQVKYGTKTGWVAGTKGSSYSNVFYWDGGDYYSDTHGDKVYKKTDKEFMAHPVFVTKDAYLVSNTLEHIGKVSKNTYIVSLGEYTGRSDKAQLVLADGKLGWVLSSNLSDTQFEAKYATFEEKAVKYTTKAVAPVTATPGVTNGIPDVSYDDSNYPGKVYPTTDTAIPAGSITYIARTATLDGVKYVYVGVHEGQQYNGWMTKKAAAAVGIGDYTEGEDKPTTPEVKPEVKPDPKPEVKPDPKPEVKPDPKPEVPSDIKLSRDDKAYNQKISEKRTVKFTKDYTVIDDKTGKTRTVKAGTVAYQDGTLKKGAITYGFIAENGKRGWVDTTQVTKMKEVPLVSSSMAERLVMYKVQKEVVATTPVGVQMEENIADATFKKDTLVMHLGTAELDGVKYDLITNSEYKDAGTPTIAGYIPAGNIKKYEPAVESSASYETSVKATNEYINVEPNAKMYNEPKASASTLIQPLNYKWNVAVIETKTVGSTKWSKFAQGSRVGWTQSSNLVHVPMKLLATSEYDGDLTPDSDSVQFGMKHFVAQAERGTRLMYVPVQGTADGELVITKTTRLTNMSHNTDFSSTYASTLAEIRQTKLKDGGEFLTPDDVFAKFGKTQNYYIDLPYLGVDKENKAAKKAAEQIVAAGLENNVYVMAPTQAQLEAVKAVSPAIHTVLKLEENVFNVDNISNEFTDSVSFESVFELKAKHVAAARATKKFKEIHTHAPKSSYALLKELFKKDAAGMIDVADANSTSDDTASMYLDANNLYPN